MRKDLYETAPELTVMGDLLPDRMDGLYCLETDTILIDRHIDFTKKRCTLVRELVHRWYGDDGDMFLIARELDRTVQVILDLQRLLRDNLYNRKIPSRIGVREGTGRQMIQIRRQWKQTWSRKELERRMLRISYTANAVLTWAKHTRKCGY